MLVGWSAEARHAYQCCFPTHQHEWGVAAWMSASASRSPVTVSEHMLALIAWHPDYLFVEASRACNGLASRPSLIFALGQRGLITRCLHCRSYVVNASVWASVRGTHCHASACVCVCVRACLCWFCTCLSLFVPLLVWSSDIV